MQIIDTEPVAVYFILGLILVEVPFLILN